MGYRLPSYKSADCCVNTHCCYDSKENPCWGQTTVVDEQCTEDYSDCWWIHACEGHAETGYKPYKESTYPEDQNAEIIDDDF